MAKPLQLLASAIFLSLTLSLTAQEYRTFDGTNNNLETLTWGVNGENLIRFTGNGYGDLISEPGGISRPNPRTISNEIFAQDDLIEDKFKLSSMVWVFGQLIDHDLGLTENHPTEDASVPVPAGDLWMDPIGTGTAEIHVARNEFDPSTGTGRNNIRRHPNRISAYLDGSCVYGSSIEVANWLRSFEDGKMKVTADGLLPYNTTDGEFSSPIDPDAPHMADDVGFFDKLFVAGDVRANENILLTAFHNIFVLEHNTTCDELKEANPTWSEEQLYQKARAITTGKLQSIFFNEWLPSLGLDLAPYTGYKSDVNVQLTNLFTAAAFRMGHTLLNSELLRLDEDGEVIPLGNITLQNAFFNPPNFVLSGMDNLFRGMGSLMQNRMDNKVVDDVRNFLFGAPGSGRGGLDLVTINIQRGRERGLADYNSVRESYGLEKFTSFSEMTDKPELAEKLRQLYGNVDNVDAWVGLLCEKTMDNSIFAETMHAILKEQFERTRDGDRYFYQIDPTLTEEEKELVDKSRMVEIILRNTGIKMMQGNVFKMMKVEKLQECGPEKPLADVSGSIVNKKGLALENVQVSLLGENRLAPTESNGEGDYAIHQVPVCYDYGLVPEKEGNQREGISSLDLVKTRLHLLEIAPFISGYEYLAADVNEDNNISVVDVLSMLRLILEKEESFPTERAWRFVADNHQFDPNDYFANISDTLMIDNMKTDLQYGFTGVKIGDLDDSYQKVHEVETRTGKSVDLIAQEVERTNGQVTFRLAIDAQTHEGFQFTLNIHPDYAALLDVHTLGNFTPLNYDVKDEFSLATASEKPQDGAFLEVTLEVNDENIALDQLIHLSDNSLRAEAYTKNLDTRNLDLKVNSTLANTSSFELYLSGANPFIEQTELTLVLPQAVQTEVQLFDMQGKLVHQQTFEGAEGANQIEIGSEALNHSGNYIVRTNNVLGTKSLILSKF